VFDYVVKSRNGIPSLREHVFPERIARVVSKWADETQFCADPFPAGLSTKTTLSATKIPAAIFPQRDTWVNRKLRPEVLGDKAFN
jgi:hypothetical protein